jgi:hypothetical protein
MGQKVNPIIFRSGIHDYENSLWIAKQNSHLFIQDQEIKNFLTNLLKSKGIFLRSSRILRSRQKLLIVLDLYFSYILAKQMKFFWARSLFKTIKIKYSKLSRIKYIKDFSQTLENFEEDFIGEKPIMQIKRKFLPNFIQRKKNFLFVLNKRKNLKLDFLSFKKRFYFFLFVKKNKMCLDKKKGMESQLSVFKNYRRKYKAKSSFIRLNFEKFSKLFAIKKFRYNFRSFSLKTSFLFRSKKTDSQNLLDLNQKICGSIQKFTGIESVELKFVSSQLSFLPTFKLYKRILEKELSSFSRNKNMAKFFFEVQENLFFVLGTFGYGNARLLGKLLTFLLENGKKQLFIVKFLKKSLEAYFKKFPSSFFAVQGIKVLLKGRFNKRRRTKKIVLQQGQVSLQTLKVPIDYYQGHAVTMYGTFGVKVWLAKNQD